MSSIEWTSKSWNPTTGCTHYSSSKNGGNECLNCYAERETNRYKHMPNHDKYHKGFDVVVEHEDSLNDPYEWKEPCTIFVNSMSDLFHRDISDDFIRKVFKVMNETPHHTYQILTKRHTRFEKLPNDLIWTDNIWMGVSCGTQYSTRRIPALVESKAKHKFLSIEPFIQEITEINLEGIDWVIVGGESGSNTYQREKDENGQDKFEIIDGKVVYKHALDADGKKIIEKVIRPMRKEWVEFIQIKCAEYIVPFFFKQWGKVSNNPDPNDPTIEKEHRYHSKGGSLLNGKVYWSNPTIKNDIKPIIQVFGNEYLVMDEYEGLNNIWELKSFLPFMDKDLLQQLKEDIRKNGLNDPILYITTPKGIKLVIEGHTRLSAVISLKKKVVPTKEIKESFKSIEDVKFWMIRHQLQRRNLSNVEKLSLANKFRPEIEKVAKQNLIKSGKNKSLDTASVDTNLEIAKIAGVSRATAVMYSQILNKGNENLLKSLESGKVSISSAHAQIKDKATNKITPVKPIKQKTTTKEFNPRVLTSIEEGHLAIYNGELDMFILLKDESKLSDIKRTTGSRIGIFYVDRIDV